MKKLMVYMILFLFCLSFVYAANVEIIFDASQSMDNKIEGQKRIDIAKTAISDFVSSLPADTNIALRVFGSDVAECSSTLKIPFTTSKSIQSTLNMIEANGLIIAGI